MKQIMTIIYMSIQYLLLFYFLIVNACIILKSIASVAILREIAKKLIIYINNYKIKLFKSFFDENLNKWKDITNKNMFLVVKFYVFSFIFFIIEIVKIIFSFIIFVFLSIIKKIMVFIRTIYLQKDIFLYYRIAKFSLLISIILTYLVLQLNLKYFDSNIVGVYENIAFVLVIPIFVTIISNTEKQLLKNNVVE